MPTWTTPATITDGTVVDASDWNTQCVGNVEWLGEVLQATAPGRRRLNHNGELTVWQAGTSFTANGETADNWSLTFSGGTCTVSRIASTPAQILGQGAYLLRAVTAAQSAAGDYTRLVAKLEDVRVLAGQTVSVSFWAKAGATANLGVEVGQHFGTGGTPSTYVSGVGQTVEVGTAWARFTVEGLSVPSVAGKTLGTNEDHNTQIRLWLSAGSTYATESGSVGVQNETIELWGLQVEVGDVATRFEAWTPAENLAICQRYYQQLGPHGGTRWVGTGFIFSTTAMVAVIQLPTIMRVAPTVTVSAGNDFTIHATGQAKTTAVAASFVSPQQVGLDVTSGGLSAGQGAGLSTNQDPTNAAIMMDARLA